MYTLHNQNIGTRKRNHEGDEESSIEGFAEHRSKRVLAIRSPEFRRQQLTTPLGTNQPPRSPSVADITPTCSDSEEAPCVYESKSAFSPWSSSPVPSYLSSSQPSLNYNNSQTMCDVSMTVDDMDMGDSHLLPGAFHNESATSISGRLPTPINAQFSRQLPSQFSHSMTISQEAPERDRRLPSPISEGATTPSISVSQEDMSMDMDTVEERITPKKGHARSKHSLRNWTGFNPDAGNVKKFSMGYKADCEKCRNRVPGHFSHIISYPNGYD